MRFVSFIDVLWSFLIIFDKNIQFYCKKVSIYKINLHNPINFSE